MLTFNRMTWFVSQVTSEIQAAVHYHGQPLNPFYCPTYFIAVFKAYSKTNQHKTRVPQCLQILTECHSAAIDPQHFTYLFRRQILKHLEAGRNNNPNTQQKEDWGGQDQWKQCKEARVMLSQYLLCKHAVFPEAEPTYIHVNSWIENCDSSLESQHSKRQRH